MHASPFETEPERPAARRTEPEARPEMRASPPGDDDQGGDEAIDEPGYGHGV